MTMNSCSADLEKMIDLFLSLDKNEDGVVSKDELQAACEEKKLDMNQVKVSVVKTFFLRQFWGFHFVN